MASLFIFKKHLCLVNPLAKNSVQQAVALKSCKLNLACVSASGHLHFLRTESCLIFQEMLGLCKAGLYGWVDIRPHGSSAVTARK